MRSCSRCAGVGGAALLLRRFGQVDLLRRRRVHGVRQPPSSKPSATAAGAARRLPGSPCCAVGASSAWLALQFSSAISICSGRLASIRGPLRTSTQPRTRTRRFSSVFGLKPGARKDALMTFRYGDRERLRPSPPEIHIYGAAALADRQHLAFDDRETAPVRPRAPAGYRQALWHIADRPRGQAWRAGPPVRAPKALPRRRDARLRAHPGVALGQHRWAADALARGPVRKAWARRGRSGLERRRCPKFHGLAGEELASAARAAVRPAGIVRGGTSSAARRISRPSSNTKLRPSTMRITCPRGQSGAARGTTSWARNRRRRQAPHRHTPAARQGAPTSHVLTKMAEWGATAARTVTGVKMSGACGYSGALSACLRAC